ncbi:MAG: hypothetical protein WB699_13150 [Bacteroidota bacterium]
MRNSLDSTRLVSTYQSDGLHPEVGLRLFPGLRLIRRVSVVLIGLISEGKLYATVWSPASPQGRRSRRVGGSLQGEAGSMK